VKDDEGDGPGENDSTDGDEQVLIEEWLAA